MGWGGVGGGGERGMEGGGRLIMSDTVHRIQIVEQARYI